MNEAEMVNGAGRIERAFDGVRCEWRQDRTNGEWGIAVYEDERYICSLFSAGLVRDIESVGILMKLGGVSPKIGP